MLCIDNIHHIKREKVEEERDIERAQVTKGNVKKPPFWTPFSF